MKHTATLQTKARTFTATIIETPDRVFFSLVATRYGNFGDETQLAAWIADIVAPYEKDPRPIVMDNQHSGEVATIRGNEHCGVVIIEPPPTGRAQ